MWDICQIYRISHRQYFSHVINTQARRRTNAGGRVRIVVEIRVDALLEEHGRSYYWLAKETGISHTTLWRLKKGKALGINFVTLEGICQALKCQPGEVLRLAGGGKVKRRGS